MTNEVTVELTIFLLCCAGGVMSGFLYDIFRIMRRLRSCGGAAVFVQDIIYWIINTLLIFTVMLYVCSGEIRWYRYAAVLVGFLLYNLAVSRFVIAGSVAVVRCIAVCVCFVVKCAIYPFFLVYRLLYRPLKRIKAKISEKIMKIRLTIRHFCFTIKKSIKNLRNMCGKR